MATARPETEQLLEQAMQSHREGRLPAARSLYQALLNLEPRHALALFRHGLLELQAGDAPAAYRLLSQAVSEAPAQARYQLGLGAVAEQLGQWPEAIAAYQAAIALEAGDADTYNALGNCLRRGGSIGLAESAYREALRLQPERADALSNLGSLLFECGSADHALALLRRAVEREPQVAVYGINFGIALCQRREFIEAETVLRQVVNKDPAQPEAAFNLAIALKGAGRTPEAAREYRRAIELRPRYAEAFVNLGNLHKESGEFAAAAAAYEGALRTRPDSIEALNNAGCLLRILGRLGEAEAFFRRALAIDPGNAALHDNLGSVLKDSGELDGALEAYREALRLDPGRAATHSNLCYALGFQCADPAPILAECRRWNQHFAAGLPDASAPHPNALLPGRRLRIGYVSADFRDHCQALFMLPLLSQHSHASFEIICYSSVEREDEVTARIRALVDGWREVRSLDDASLAALIRRDGIDILVDLAMHMAGGRPQAFARKPAPLQVAWLAYPGTTGLDAMDYRLSDPYLDPPHADPHYAERTIRLADSFWCYEPLTDALQVNELPALSRGYVTFGCLNNPCKFTDQTLALWGKVLHAVPSARLLLMAAPGPHRLRLALRLEARGIAADRVKFLAFRPRAEYLRSYHDIDLGLDTLPYNGHTTSLDALWMGVPVITRVGKTCVGRAGFSQLKNIGLPELAADTDGDYVAAVVALATNLARLAALRRGLRARLVASPLMDAPRFARQMEAAYRGIWADYCRRSGVDGA